MDKPPVILRATTAEDPFVSPAAAASHRYASYDNTQLTSLYNSSSPSQAKRAIEAHLKDTDRRIQDASRLGQTLLKQRKDLADRLKDVEHHTDDTDIGPDLRKKLADLEKEYTEVGRESARTFLPKNRIVSQDPAMPGSPAVFAADSRASPSKVSAPSRRQRNQPTNRVHDIEFATEISTSLLAQVRQLQAVLAEKDDTLKTTTAAKAQVEADLAAVMHRLKVLDENEQKYKEENWNLETQLQELHSNLKLLTDKEQRLTQILTAAQADKDAAQRELEDLKHSHGKLVEDHDLYRKHNDSELNTLRRDLAHYESQHDILHKKIDDLTHQNTELARAVAARWHDGNTTSDREFATADEDGNGDRTDPEDSPPASPSKTPARNGMLESETLRSSLTHAHRMIQNLKNNIHREKTEKIELKRMLQDARDEVESLRNGGNASVTKKRRSTVDIKKQQIRPDRLGATRSSTHEIIMDDDEDWEDNAELSPSRAAATRQRGVAFANSAYAEPDSTDAFETANERGGTTTESDAFETGVETLGGGESSDEMTETEGTVDRARRSTSSRPSMYDPSNRYSFMSTASTDEETVDSVTTPIQHQHPKLRLRNINARRSSAARASSIYTQEPSVLNDSPSSMISSERGTPRAAAGQSLMAELEGLSDEEADDAMTIAGSTVSSARSSPEVQRQRTVSAASVLSRAVSGPLPPFIQPTMVDSGMMTEPWEPEPKSVISAAAGAVGGAIAGVAGFALGRAVHDDKHEDDADIEQRENITQPAENVKGVAIPDSKTLSDDVATPHREATQRANMGTPRVPLQKLTDTVSQQTLPVSPFALQEKKELLYQLAFSSTITTETEPISPPRAILPTPPSLAVSSFLVAHTEPQAPVIEQIETKPLAMSIIASQQSVPVTPIAKATEPILPALSAEPAPPSLAVSSFVVAHTEPQAPVLEVTETKPLTMSFITSQHLEPIAPAVDHTEDKTLVIEQVEPKALTMSTILSQQSEPVTPATGLRGAEFDTTPKNRPVYVSTGFSPEKALYVVPGTESVKSGAVFFANNPAIPHPSSQSTLRPSSARSGSAERRYVSKSVDVFEDENATVPIAGRPGSSGSRTPFAEVSHNAASSQRSTAEQDNIVGHTSGSGTQTVVPSDQPDDMSKNKGKAPMTIIETVPSETVPRRSSDSAAPRFPRRPASSGSIRKNGSPAPPLPPDHTIKIAAAAGQMGPPGMPASAYRSLNAAPPRSRTPSFSANSARHGTMPRPRVSHSSSLRPTLNMSPQLPTRTSSVTSFASELDERFHINRSNIYPDDMPAMTDPRMIQAITQTMIGEHLWKYTRKTGRSSEISDTRHRRFFWVHPYTRTLYWSETDPSVHGAKQSKAKSVAIESVRVVSDNNTYPPGLHTKSLVVVTPGRDIVFTAPTRARHETWFNALSYLLLRTGAEREEDANDTLGELTKDDVDEFNPQMAARSMSHTSGRTGHSLSTYNSRVSGRTTSPVRREYTIEAPTLSRRTGEKAAASQRSRSATPYRASNTGSVSSRFGAIFKSPGSLRDSISGSMRSRSALSNRPADPSELVEEDSEGDLRAMVERSRREMEDAGLMENVRACCNGKHDVGSLSRNGGRHTHHVHNHDNNGTVNSRTGAGSVMSRYTTTATPAPIPATFVQRASGEREGPAAAAVSEGPILGPVLGPVRVAEATRAE